MSNIVGIDPGVGRTGVVILSDGGDILRYATFSSGTGPPDYVRARDLGLKVAEYALDLGPAETNLRLVIESPIYNRNVANFSLQWRCFQEFISGMDDVSWELEVMEVNPKTVKKLFTGDGKADKDAMVAASSFGHITDQKNREALADAEAIARCALYKPPPGVFYTVKPSEITKTAVVRSSLDGLDGLDPKKKS